MAEELVQGAGVRFLEGRGGKYKRDRLHLNWRAATLLMGRIASASLNYIDRGMGFNAGVRQERGWMSVRSR